PDPTASNLAVAPADTASSQPSFTADSTLGTIGLDPSGQVSPAFQTVVDPAAAQPQPQPATPTPQADTPPATQADPFSFPALPALGDINLLGTPPASTANPLSSDASSAASAPSPAADGPPPGSPDVAAGSWSPSAPYAWQPRYDTGSSWHPSYGAPAQAAPTPAPAASNPPAPSSSTPAAAAPAPASGAGPAGPGAFSTTFFAAVPCNGLNADGWQVSESGGQDPGRGGVTEDNSSANAPNCDYILRTGNSHVVSLYRRFQLPGTGAPPDSDKERPPTLEVDYSDWLPQASPSPRMNDAFEIALLDGNSQLPLTNTIAPGRDAFFNLTAGQPSRAAPGV